MDVREQTVMKNDMHHDYIPIALVQLMCCILQVYTALHNNISVFPPTYLLFVHHCVSILDLPATFMPPAVWILNWAWPSGSLAKVVQETYCVLLKRDSGTTRLHENDKIMCPFTNLKTTFIILVFIWPLIRLTHKNYHSQWTLVHLLSRQGKAQW